MSSFFIAAQTCDFAVSSPNHVMDQSPQSEFPCQARAMNLFSHAGNRATREGVSWLAVDTRRAVSHYGEKEPRSGRCGGEKMKSSRTVALSESSARRCSAHSLNYRQENSHSGARIFCCLA